LGKNEYEVWETGSPVMKNALAAFDCRIVDRHKAGDHVILIAEVVKFSSRSGAPLIYFASRYAEGPEAE
jgi:flavin reductase (DIM6/NTAB) family NADH-FMN oxidoreductase RutF